MTGLSVPPLAVVRPLESAEARYERIERALAQVQAPFACLDLGPFWENARELSRRAAGKPIRVATKSVRCRGLLEQLLSSPLGFKGLMAFTLPEALWLARAGFKDVLVAYPTVDRLALRELASSELAARITLTVDAEEQLDFLDTAVGTRQRALRVCLDVDAGFHALGGAVKIGAKRSPLHDTAQVKRLAEGVAKRRGFTLVGLMAYEAQIAGVGDAPPGRPLYGLAVRAMQRLSRSELMERRAEIVAEVKAVSPLEFVNGGGTGSLESTAKEQAVTELAAGSGLFGPALFDQYRSFHPQAAALFALPVVRRPGPNVVTVLGGGYVASGAGGPDRLPRPTLPQGLSLDPKEGAGEVQTPLLGLGAGKLGLGARVYFRHAKAGELCERFERLELVEGEHRREPLPTYRGEGHCFL